VRKAIWTLITWPPHLATAARLDDNIAKVGVELFMPLSLQLFWKQADVGPKLDMLLALLLWFAISAATDATSMPCNTACTQQP